MKIFFKYLLFFLASLIIAVGQISFLNNLDLYYVYLLLIIMLTFFNFKSGLILAVSLGLLLDILNYQFFGLNLTCLIMIVFLINYLNLNYLTHKNFVSFGILTIVGFISYQLYLIIINMIIKLFGLNFGYFELENLRFVLLQFFTYLLIFTIFYMFFNLFKRKLKTKW